MSAPRPAPDDEFPSLQDLSDWLSALPDQERIVGGEYRVRDLVEDIEQILAAMWNDGIDARGEDA